MSALIPVIVGVLLAFAWNTVGSHQAAMTTSGSVVAPQVGVAVEQAAAQAWASVSHPHVTAARGAARIRRHARVDSAVAFTCLKRPQLPSVSRHIS